MEKLISVEALKDWIENWFKVVDYYKYGDDPRLRNKKVSRKKIDLDELYDILARMPDEGKAKTNFEWLVEEKKLKEFLSQLYDHSYSGKQICDMWGIKTPYGGLWWDPKETIADWLTDPHIDKDVFDEEEIHENCTVQILRNSATGEESIGWWENGKSN